MTDADFLREFRKGNKEAFSGLVEKYSKPITMMILRMVKDLEEARDISQTVFLKAYEGSAHFHDEFFVQNLVIPYRNECRQRLHSETKTKYLCWIRWMILLGRPHLPANNWTVLRYLEQLKRAIEELPEKQRLTLQLRIYDELNYKEIAKVLGGTAGSARGNFFQATRTLRLKLGSEK